MGVTTRGGARACRRHGLDGRARARPAGARDPWGGEQSLGEGRAGDSQQQRKGRSRRARRLRSAAGALSGARRRPRRSRRRETARRRAGEAVTDVASLPVRATDSSRNEPAIHSPSRSALFVPALSPPRRAAGFPRRRATISALRTATDPALPSARDSQDDVLEVVFGHLARDASPAQYFDAMLT